MLRLWTTRCNRGLGGMQWNIGQAQRSQIIRAQHNSPRTYSHVPSPSSKRPSGTVWQTAFREGARRQIHQSQTCRQRFNYQRFQQNREFLRAWSQHPHFYYHLAGGGVVVGGFYVYNLEEVPVSHRRRFRIVSYAQEEALGEQMYQQTLQEFSNRLLPPSHPQYQMVQRAAKRLIPHCGLDDQQWELNVVQSPEKNAFVVPGGKIFVFTGMFDVCKTEDEIAAVIGHEIAHNVAHHAAERASSGVLLMIGSVLISTILGGDLGQGMLLDLIFMRPGSRTQESEADYLGLLMMAEACYDPHAAMNMWAMMEQLDQGSPPQWLSTHPSNHNRFEKIRSWLPQAEAKGQESGCSAIRPQATQFWENMSSLRGPVVELGSS